MEGLVDNGSMAANDEWLWHGGQVCLDFVNTLRDRWKTPRETLQEPDDVARWLSDAGLLSARTSPTGEPVDAQLRRQAVALREAIDRAVLNAADNTLPTPADVSVINQASAATHRPAPRLVLTNDRLESSSSTPTAQDVPAALGLVAQDAIGFLCSPAVQRVRICGSDYCALRFVDRSPARNRRWCSMTRCGNRTKARLHQARTRARS